MNSSDYYNRYLLVDNLLDDIKDTERRIRKTMKNYKHFMEMAESDEKNKKYLLGLANDMLNANNDLKQEKVRMIQELENRFEYDYKNKRFYNEDDD